MRPCQLKRQNKSSSRICCKGKKTSTKSAEKNLVEKDLFFIAMSSYFSFIFSVCILLFFRVPQSRKIWFISPFFECVQTHAKSSKLWLLYTKTYSNSTRKVKQARLENSSHTYNLTIIGLFIYFFFV